MAPSYRSNNRPRLVRIEKDEAIDQLRSAQQHVVELRAEIPPRPYQVQEAEAVVLDCIRVLAASHWNLPEVPGTQAPIVEPVVAPDQEATSSPMRTTTAVDPDHEENELVVSRNQGSSFCVWCHRKVKHLSDECESEGKFWRENGVSINQLNGMGIRRRRGRERAARRNAEVGQAENSGRRFAPVFNARGVYVGDARSRRFQDRRSLSPESRGRESSRGTPPRDHRPRGSEDLPPRRRQGSRSPSGRNARPRDRRPRDSRSPSNRDGPSRDWRDASPRRRQSYRY